MLHQVMKQEFFIKCEIHLASLVYIFQQRESIMYWFQIIDFQTHFSFKIRVWQSIVLQNLCWNTYILVDDHLRKLCKIWTFLEVTNTPHIYCVVVGVIVIERMGWILLHIKPFFAASSSQTFVQGDTRMTIVHMNWTTRIKIVHRYVPYQIEGNTETQIYKSSF